MEETKTDIILGTASMLSIAACVLVIVFLFIITKSHGFIDAKKIYKDWILFSGVTLIALSIAFSLAFEGLRDRGFSVSEIKLLLIYNTFVRSLGLMFVLVWLLIFQMFIIGDQIDKWYNKWESKSR